MISERPAPDAIEQYDKSSQLVNPTFGDSVFNHINEGVFIGNELLNKLSPKPDEHLQNVWDSIQIKNERESERTTFGQKVLRFIPEQIGLALGMAFNPITFATAELGSLAAKPMAALGGKLLPNVARKTIPQLTQTPLGAFLPQTLGELGATTTKGFTTLAGFQVPEAVIHNYNRDTRSLSWGGFTEEVGFAGGIGALLSIPGYAAGVLFKKLFAGDKNVPMPNTESAKDMPSVLAKAFEDGKLTKEEYEWGVDLYKEPHKADLMQRAADILKKKGHDVDMAKLKVDFSMLSDKDWENLSSTFADQLSNAELVRDKTALSDFILGNNLDKLRESPEKIDGLKGYVAEMDEKLSHKDAKLAEADRILEDHLERDLKERMPFDQRDIYEQVKANPTEHLPYTVPEIVNQLLGHEKQAKRLEKQPEAVRIEHENKKPALHSPKEELKAIKKKLLSGKRLPRGYEYTPEYSRLVDLADVWHNAQSLLDRVHLQRDYERQEAFRNIVKAYTDVLESHTDKFSNPEKVRDYLKQRIDHAAGITNEMKAAPQPLRTEMPETVPQEEQLNVFDQEVEEAKLKTLGDEYYDAKKRYKQFQKAGKSIKEMVDCFRSQRG